MTGRTAILMAAMALGGVSACGDNSGEQFLDTLTTVSDVFAAGSDDGGFAETANFSGVFTPDAVAANPDSYQLVTINALGVAELAYRTTDNENDDTWLSQSGFSVSYRDGVVVATRGLVGEDIMAANAPGLLSALQAGGGTTSRAMEALDSLNQVQTSTFACTVTSAGTENINLGVREVDARRFDENCRGEAVVFDNIYWLDDQGTIIASRQYVSPTVAYLRSNRL